MGAGRKLLPLDKSVFFWTQQGFGYGYGKGFRDRNAPNLNNGIMKANEDFETSERRNAIGVIAISVEDLLISGSGMFIDRITQKMKEKSEADSYEGNDATYLGIEIAKVGDGEFGGIALGSVNYERGINHIGIPHGRTRAPKEPLTEDAQSISRSELGKLMRVARIARAGAIYDASAAAQTLSGGGFWRF